MVIKKGLNSHFLIRYFSKFDCWYLLNHNDEFINQQAADSAFPDINEAPESYSVESEEDYSPEKMGNNGFYPDDNDLEELIQEDGDDDGPNDSHYHVNNSVGDHADVQDDSHGGDSDVEFYV